MEENKQEFIDSEETEIETDELLSEEPLQEQQDEQDKRSTVEAVNDVKDITKKIYKTTSVIGKGLIVVFSNPITWVGIVIALLGIIGLSGSKVIGQSDHNLQCTPGGSAQVNVDSNADDFTRQSAIASWLTSTPFESFGGKPMTKEQAAGVIGNFIVESAGGKPHYVETLSMHDPDYYKQAGNDVVLSWGSVSGKAVGIAQWDSGRRVGLVNFAKEQGKEWYDLNVQLNFLKKELDGGEGANLAKGGFTDLTKTPEEYARLWNRLFERSAGDDNSPHVIKRKDAAKEFASKYQGGGGMLANCTGGSIDTSNVAQLAIQVSWPLGDMRARQNCSGFVNCGMDFSKPEYIEAKRLAEEKTSKDPIQGLLASCDRFVATMYRATGADPDYPWGAVGTQEDYMRNSPKWQEISCQDRQPGDVIVESETHIMLYVGDVDGKDSLASASSQERTASIMPVSCNGASFNADGFPNAKGWRLVK